MSFDPATFEAEVALKLIPTEQLPSVALDALEAGFDGPHVLRMAILEPTAGWAIDQALSPMLKELGLESITPKDAALRLARQRAQRILDLGEDPLASISYFHRLLLAADYPDELYELAYLDEDGLHANDEEMLESAREALQELLSPELLLIRQAERKAAWEREHARLKTEWPYVLNSPSGRALLRRRYLEKLTYIRPILWLNLAVWIGVGWLYRSWRTTAFGLIASMAFLVAICPLAEYLKMRRERRDILLRHGVPEDLI